MKQSNDLLYARSPQPLYLQVAAIVRRNIERGVWPRGQQVPALENLVEDLGVSRATIRQAFGLLEREGLIHRSRGSGTYVNENIPQPVKLALPTSWEETVALSAALGTTTLMELSADVPLPLLGMDCPFDCKGSFQRYRHATVVSVLNELHGDKLTHAEQLVSIIEAGADSAQALHLPLAAPVAELRRYACIDQRVIYFARLEIPTRYVQMKFDLIENRTHV
ncbi:MAG: GntR family transcriptional regulator [Burkholderiales bacterium]|nr:GntR family transcriptional regulator [Burkholderiales bacterium]